MGICTMAGSETARERAKEQLRSKMEIDMKGTGSKITFTGNSFILFTIVTNNNKI